MATVRAVYVAMSLVAWSTILPLSFAALLSGLAQSLGTEWGLFRHHWVLIKFVLTVLAVGLLLLHLRPIDELARAAADGVLGSTELRRLRIQIAADAAAALVVLLVNTTLSVFKPKGLTRYGRRKRPQELAAKQAPRSASPGGMPFAR